MKGILTKWNTWWDIGKVPENKKLILREDVLDRLKRLLPSKEVLILTGVRRSGKSTIIYQLIDFLLKSVSAKNILYFNFDEPLQEKSIKTIEAVFSEFLKINNPKGRKYVFFDEIQTISGWEKWIKKYYDLHGKDIKFLITGSNNSMLSSNLSKLLTGRIFTNNVFPLSFTEFLKFKGVKIKSLALQKEEIIHYFGEFLDKGGFPEVVLEKDDDVAEMRLKEYFDGILLRDVISSKNIRETAKLSELVHYLITNVSTLFSYNKLANTVGISLNSVKEYLSFLEDAYLLFQVNFFSYSVKKSIMIQMPRKIYCIDNGLRNAVSFRFSKDGGRLVENLVFIELKRREKEVFYWKNSNEVDFVIKNKDDSLTAINVSDTNDINKREIEGLLEFKKSFKRIEELLILTNDTEKKEKGIKFVPVWKWLLGE
ncbi:ATP-binding protein [Candidatus Woesearchaeota archaeon]|nr:MAG: ATP-binding protein [Candidatus Woesearchaeota archaeon]